MRQPIAAPQTTMDIVTSSRATSLTHYAARLSWVCPIITIMTFAFLMLGGQIIPRRAIALIASSALCILLIGLILAVVALLGISRHGTRRILAPAIVGIIINGLLFSFVVASFVASRARRTQQRGSIDVSAVRVVRVVSYQSPVSAGGVLGTTRYLDSWSRRNPKIRAWMKTLSANAAASSALIISATAPCARTAIPDGDRAARNSARTI